MNSKPLLLFYKDGEFAYKLELECQEAALASLHDLAVKKELIKPEDGLAFHQCISGAMIFPELGAVFYPQGTLKRSLTQSLKSNNQTGSVL